MKRVDNVEQLRALALRKGAEVVGPGGARFNSTRARVARPMPPGSQAPEASAAIAQMAASAAIAQMAAAITEAISAAQKPSTTAPPSPPRPAPEAPPQQTTAPPPIASTLPLPRAAQPQPASVVASTAPPAQPILAGEIQLQTNAAGAISGCRMDLPDGRSLTMKVQHKFGLVESAAVTIDGRQMRFTVHRHPVSHRAETMSFTSGA